MEFPKLNSLIKESDISQEEDIIRNPNGLNNWINYYSSKSDDDLYSKVFILQRAVTQLPKSEELWEIYLNLLIEASQLLNYYHHKREITIIQHIFDQALQLLGSSWTIWHKYLSFLTEKMASEVTLIRRKFNLALYNLKDHGLLWPLYLQFADEIGGPTAVSIYKKYLQYIDYTSLKGLSKDSMNIQDFIEKFIEFEDFKQASILFEKILEDPNQYLELPKPTLQIWIDYFDMILEFPTKSDSLDHYFELLVQKGLVKFPDQIGTFYLKLTTYFKERTDYIKTRYYFDQGIKVCVSVLDFVTIYDAYVEFEEEEVMRLSKELEEEEGEEEEGEEKEEGKLSELSPSELSSSESKSNGSTKYSKFTEFEFRMNYFENLLNNREILQNDMMLRQDINNIDEWIKRVEIYKDNLDQVLQTYVLAITKVNPFMAHSLSNNPDNKLSRIWINYANVYASRNDFKTADAIFRKSVTSQFKHTDELAELYIQWSETALTSNSDDADTKAVEIIEQVLFKRKEPQNDLDIHKRIYRSAKLWSYYLDLLESFIESEDQKDDIEKVTKAYMKMVELKIATPTVIINYASLLQSWNYFEQSFTAYEMGLKQFNDAKIKFEIWNVYLTKILSRDVDIERARDLFEQCLFGESPCPASMSKSVILLYSKYEQDKGFVMNSIKVLKQGIKKLSMSLQEPLDKQEKDQIIKDKFDLYLILTTQIEKVDRELLRETYETALDDDLLTFPQVIHLTTQFIDFEANQQELVRVRTLFKFVCRLTNPSLAIITPVWTKWENFEIEMGNESSFKDMLRFKRDITKEFEDNKAFKESLNPMGFVKSSEVIETSETNPDQIDLDMDM
jgi:pre-mRNA-splicing factor SYF1